MQEPPRERKAVGIIYSAYTIGKGERVWMTIQKWSGLVVDEQTELNRGANHDVIVTDIRRRGDKITRIVIIYNESVIQSGERQT